MQNEMQHNGREGSRPEEAKTGASRAATPTEASTESGVMAAFSLLADPATIAGGLRAEAPGVGETKAKAEHETKAPGVVEAKAERETSAEPGVSADESGSDALRPGLMDAASARRLAAEARARQRASREALAAAQRELTEQRAANGSPEPTLYADAEIAPAPSPSPADPSPSGWHQRPLATRPSSRISVDGAEAEAEAEELGARPPAKAHDEAPRRRRVRSEDAMHPNERDASPSEADATRAALHAARAEAIELRAMLDLARETSQRQRTVLGELRDRLATAETGAAGVAEPEPGPALTLPTIESTPTGVSDAPARAESDEIGTLRARVARADLEIAEHLDARRRLEALLSERDALLNARREQLDALSDRLEAQDRALDAARREYEIERARHTRTLETLARLRDALTDATSDALGPLPTPPAHSAHSACSTGSTASTCSTSQVSDAAMPPVSPVPEAEPMPMPMPSTPAESGPAAAPATGPATIPQRIVAAGREEATRSGPWNGPTTSAGATWAHFLDERVRSRFGPLGAERLADLVRGTRRSGRPGRGGEATFLLLARGAADVGPRLAESLLASGESAFTLHCVDHPATQGRGGDAWPSEAPIHALIEHAAPIAAAEQLDALLDALEPDAIVCHDFLSHEPEVGSWLDRLAREARDGCTLVFAERAGITPPRPPESLCALAERIWTRMPERYRRGPEGHLASWSEALESSLDRPANGLYEALRERLRPELTDRFGHLALAFVDSPMSARFDASAERDQRFLAQLADLDEHRIEAGEVPALAFVARVDPEDAA